MWHWCIQDRKEALGSDSISQHDCALPLSPPSEGYFSFLGKGGMRGHSWVPPPLTAWTSLFEVRAPSDAPSLEASLCLDWGSSLASLS